MVVAVGCGASAPPAPVLQIESTGAAPQLLRFAPRPHVPEHFELAFKQRTKVKITNTVLEESETLVDWPTVKLVGTLEATRVDASGADIEMTVIAAHVLEDDVDPRVRSALEDTAARSVGRRVTWHRAPNGTPTDVVGEKSDLDFNRIMPSGWRLPDEPVGVGARWRVVEIKRDRVEWHSTTTYELRALENGVATLGIHVDMRAGSQAMSVEPGATSRLRSGTANVEIEVRLGLDKLVVDGSGIAMTTLDANVTRKDLRIMTSTTIEQFFGMKPCTAASVEACGH